MRGAGKSYLAGKLATLFGDAVVLAFATKLRQLCVDHGYLTQKEAFGKPTSLNARTILRERSEYFKTFYGTRDYFANECWVKWTLLDALEIPVIIQDVRHACEADKVLKAKGVLIYLGDWELTSEQMSESSFQELPVIYERANYRLPAKPSEEKILDLFNTLRLNRRFRELDKQCTQ